MCLGAPLQGAGNGQTLKPLAPLELFGLELVAVPKTSFEDESTTAPLADAQSDKASDSTPHGVSLSGGLTESQMSDMEDKVSSAGRTTSGDSGALHTNVDDQLLSKTKLCKFFTRGFCSRGRTCTFAHGRKELRAQPNLFRTELCFEFMSTGSCHHGQSCKYAHSEEELRMPLAVEEKAPKEKKPKRAGAELIASKLAQMEEEAAALRAQLKLLEAQAGFQKQVCTPTASVTASKSLDESKFSSEPSSYGGATEAEHEHELVVDWVVKNGCLHLAPVQTGSRNRSHSAPPHHA
mmetsp:Transcript_33211/g.71204  ORF Transcript_33211/g.71204 Transcript_33211/m.71204 type:complete len:293 (+) Transcript_33211:227-1105(+)